MNKIWNLLKTHKKTSIAILVILIVGLLYYHSAHTATATTYVVKPVSLGTVETTVSGTGQVSSSQELTVYPQVSGTVLTVNVKNGDSVTQGQVLATLDSTNAYYSLRNAQIALAKLQTSNPISNTSDEDSVTNSQASLQQSYQNAFNTIASAYTDMGPIITSLNDIFYTTSVSPYFSNSGNLSQNYGETALDYRQTAGVILDQTTNEYKAFRPTYLATTLSATSSIASSLAQEYAIAQDLASTIKNTNIAISYIINQTTKSSRTSAMTSDQNNISTWLSTVNSDNSSLSSALTNIENADQTLTQAQANLSADQTTNSPLDLQSAELSLQQAQTTYDEYTVRAPFDGIVGNVTLRPGDTAGGSTAVATVVTNQYISTIVLNEVDVAKVTVGQPVDITFNALPNITATGTVTDVDAVGTVSQGVVSYNVVISINTTDPQVKAGMSINADIVTAEADNVVVVPNSAIKTQGGRSYVQIPASSVTAAAASTARTYGSSGNRSFGSSTRSYGNGVASSTASSFRYFGSSTRTGVAASTGGTVTTVSSKLVQIGLSDNTDTQIISGLNLGDLVVTQTIAGTATKAAASTNILSSLSGGRTTGGGFGGGAAGGGGFRTAATTR